MSHPAGHPNFTTITNTTSLIANSSVHTTTTYISHDGTSIITIGNSTTTIRPNIDTTNLTEIRVGILLPFSQTEDNFTHEIVWGGTSAIRMAAHEINTQGMIPGGYITLIERDSFPTNGLGQTSVTDAVYAAVTLLQQGVVGVIGDVSSSWTSLSALMTGALQIPQCSFSASAISLSDKSQYQYFFRTIPTQIIFADTMLAYVANQGWDKVSILYSDDALGQQLCEEAIIKAGLMNIHIVTYQAFYKNGIQSDTASTLKNFTDSGARIIIVAAVGDPQNAIMVQAATMGYLDDSYVWLLIGAVGSTLENAVSTYNTDVIQRIANGTATSNSVSPSAVASASDPMMVEALQAKNLSLIDFNQTFTGVVLFDTWLTPDGYPPYESFLDRWAALDPIE
ncbi:periplasmic binding protein-like I [Umbelopsis sp. AD052]|nr:periplasmic binding protein-like I [Umbelopsis sp. AD052]